MSTQGNWKVMVSAQLRKKGEEQPDMRLADEYAKQTAGINAVESEGYRLAHVVSDGNNVLHYFERTGASTRMV